MRRADGRVGWRLGLSAASNDDGEEGDSLSGLEERGAERRNEAKQGDDQGNRCGAHFAIRDTLTLVQR